MSRSLGPREHFVEQQHFVLRTLDGRQLGGGPRLVGRVGEEAVVGLGVESAGPLGRGERLLRHAGEKHVLGVDRAGGGGREDADAAGVVEAARQRFVLGEVDEQVEHCRARELRRGFAEPLGKLLERCEVLGDLLPGGSVFGVAAVDRDQAADAEAIRRVRRRRRSSSVGVASVGQLVEGGGELVEEGQGGGGGLRFGGRGG